MGVWREPKPRGVVVVVRSGVGTVVGERRGAAGGGGQYATGGAVSPEGPECVRGRVPAYLARSRARARGGQSAHAPRAPRPRGGSASAGQLSQ